ncbi:uncharacterized protein GGS25DRAFT_522923 [Hypoxylon fragiforme]|uniref:uncharacterized protein n=1 Tax=Hypoxylon fragiforme TaxID=63214 RepID=UPI0020C5B7AE|nr:uncharacterized protein GGS25DRAFT_522923 [Hypoxylon fragiforme]KAI2607402.1 hypothetical protein GGS25DRAFT_522923 [Hypoxylon fragiforme]
MPLPPVARDEQLRQGQASGNRTSEPQSNHHNGRKPEPAPLTKVPSGPGPSTNALQLGLHPRSFDELHKERLHLLQMLQQHDQSATELSQRVPAVEEQINYWTGSTDELRETKKHSGWLRYRISETVEEERRILARLSDLYVEIQCLERWCKADKDREMRDTRQRQQQQPRPMPAYESFGHSSPPPFSTPSAQHHYPNVLVDPYHYQHHPSIPYNAPWEDTQCVPKPGMYDGSGDTPQYATAHIPFQSTPESGTRRHHGLFELDDTAMGISQDGISSCVRQLGDLKIEQEPKPKNRVSMPSLSCTREIGDWEDSED